MYNVNKYIASQLTIVETVRSGIKVLHGLKGFIVYYTPTPDGACTKMQMQYTNMRRFYSYSACMPFPIKQLAYYTCILQYLACQLYCQLCNFTTKAQGQYIAILYMVYWVHTWATTHTQVLAYLYNYPVAIALYVHILLYY